jgi:hypothetical protein
MCGGIIDRAYAVRRPGQLTHRARRSPKPIGGVSTYGRQKRSSDPDAATSRQIELPAACDARDPAKIVYLNDRRVRQRGGIDQPEVDMSVDNPGHHCTRKLRYVGLLHSRTPEGHRAQFTVDLLQDCRSESMADPKIVNGKPHGYLPISVRTA